MTPEQTAIALDSLKKSRDYAAGVMDGSIIANKWVKLAVKRDEEDRIHGGERGLYFDEYAAARVIVFFSCLKHYKGEWRGQVVLLEPWQCWIICTVFGWKQANGKRRFREVYEEVARKNGKTIKLAGIAGFMLIMDGEGAPEIYAAARTREQSARAWRDARKMLGYSNATKSKLKFVDSKLLIDCPSNDGFFLPLSRDAEGVDGSNPHFGLVDELHSHPTREIYDVIKTGMGARSQPLMWAITTAGATRPKEESICLQKREYATEILSGNYTDDNFFGIIYTLDEGDDWTDSSLWVKANPNLEYQKGTDANGKPIMGGSVKFSTLQSDVTMAKNSPMLRYGVLTKNFNIWMSNAFGWANLAEWDKCQAEYTLESLAGAEVIYGGLDLGSVSDLTSLTLFAIMPGGEKRLWSHSWIAEDRVIPAIQARGVPYDRWIEDGWITATPGNSTSYDFIHTMLVGKKDDDGKVIKEGLFESLPIKKIGADDWGMGVFFKDLAADSHAVFGGVRQGYKSLSPAMKEFERLYTSGGLVHDGNPVLRWAMGNTIATVDPMENIKPDKNKSSEKIDPVVAALMAVVAWIALPEDKLESAYEEEVYI